MFFHRFYTIRITTNFVICNDNSTTSSSQFVGFSKTLNMLLIIFIENISIEAMNLV